MHADASSRAGLFDGDERSSCALDPARRTYVHVVRGELESTASALAAGDAPSSSARPHCSSADGEDAEVLVFDLA